MNKREQEKFRKILLKQLKELENKSEGKVEHLDSSGDHLPDATDRAAAESDRNFDIRVKDRERKLIIKIKEAIKRADEGTFGVCEECEEQIGAKRLEARPVTTLCIDCKIASEQVEKMRGE